MKFPFTRLGKRRPDSMRDLETIRSIFSKFQRIQKLNTRALELMAEMERALGGDYIFDSAFLESSVRELSATTYQVVYSLNALSSDRHISLFDRYQEIKNTLEDILAGGLGPFAANLTLPFHALGWEMEPLAGALGVCLAEARNRLNISAPDGFVVTTTGCRRFIRAKNTADGVSGVSESRFPSDVADAILREREELFKRRNGSTRLVIRTCAAGGYSTRRAPLETSIEVSPEDILPACESALAAFLKGAALKPGSDELAPALLVHESIPAQITGRATICSGPSAGLTRISAASAKYPKRSEHYLVQRIYPFRLVQSEIFPKALDEHVRSGETPLFQPSGGLRKGSALLDPEFLKAIVETALSIGRIIGYPPELSWARNGNGRPIVLDVRPAAPMEGEMGSDEFADLLKGVEILARGGETAQTGTSAGKVVHVKDLDDFEQFPHGSVAVARAASPQLSPILRRASAVITETGSSIGHLATIARELRIPAVFGLTGARELIPEGLEVTVDAAERTVYRGIVEPLLSSNSIGSELYPTDPEYVVLRLLLRLIQPLDLLDPDAPGFTAENCKTYHDIIHYSHERSVEELLHFQDHHRGLPGLRPRRLASNVPLDLFILDLDTALSNGTNAPLNAEEITSEPLAAFVRGLSLKEMWDRAPASFRLRDILSGLNRNIMTTGGPDYSGRNLAVVARNYMNLGLRLGYHFCVIDSFFGGNVNQDYVYFRFAGGFADEIRRRRRARLIQMLLERMDFKVSVKGDLVVGKFKSSEKAETVAVLSRLGELTAFTRQLDTSMVAEEKVEEYARLFFGKSEGADLPPEEKVHV